jgi:hypothetical protein
VASGVSDAEHSALNELHHYLLFVRVDLISRVAECQNWIISRENSPDLGGSVEVIAPRSFFDVIHQRLDSRKYRFPVIPVMKEIARDFQNAWGQVQAIKVCGWLRSGAGCQVRPFLIQSIDKPVEDTDHKSATPFLALNNLTGLHAHVHPAGPGIDMLVFVKLWRGRAKHIPYSFSNVASCDAISSGIGQDCRVDIEQLKLLDPALDLGDAQINFFCGPEFPRFNWWRVGSFHNHLRMSQPGEHDRGNLENCE